MAVEEIYYGGKEELTMAQYEALTTLEDNVDYNITDYPDKGITNAQMTFALTCKRLFNDGEIFTCNDDGDYVEGHSYRLTVLNDAKNWIDITPITEIKIDDTLSDTSTNPVQNKVITVKINEILEQLPQIIDLTEDA